jgi:uncharacterized protein (UPF0333 family)
MKKIKNEKGQTFLEFMLLMMVLLALSFGLLRGVNSNVSKMWKGMVTGIAKSKATDSPNVRFR